MKDQPKTPGAMVLVSLNSLEAIQKWCKARGWNGAANGLLHIINTAIPTEQPPAVGGEPEVVAWRYRTKDGLKHPAYTEREAQALAYDSEPLALIDRAHVAPLLAEIDRLKVDRDYCKRVAVHNLELGEGYLTRIAELEAQLANTNDWTHLKPDMDPSK